jgi:hypothetical protein
MNNRNWASCVHDFSDVTRLLSYSRCYSQHKLCLTIQMGPTPGWVQEEFMHTSYPIELSVKSPCPWALVWPCNPYFIPNLSVNVNWVKWHTISWNWIVGDLQDLILIKAWFTEENEHQSRVTYWMLSGWCVRLFAALGTNDIPLMWWNTSVHGYQVGHFASTSV